jgi:hypothetical protein
MNSPLLPTHGLDQRVAAAVAAVRAQAVMRWAAALLATLLLATGPARAAETDRDAPDPHAVQPERPTIATHAHTVAPGWVEIEAGMERDRFTDASRTSTAAAVVKVGLSRRTQLDLDPTWQRIETGEVSQSGVGDLTMGLKWRLLDGARLLGDFALEPAVKLPTGSVSNATGTGTTDASLLVISSHQVKAVSVDVNVGETRRTGNGAIVPRDAWLWTCASGIPLTARWAGALELYGFPGTRGPSGASPIVAVLLGPTFTPQPWLEVDAGIIMPVEGPQPHALYCGLVWNVGPLPRAG